MYLLYFFLKIQNSLQKSIVECRSKNYGSIGRIVNNLEFERLKTYIYYSSGHLIIIFFNTVYTFFPKIWYLKLLWAIYMMTDEECPDISVTDIHIKILPFSWKTKLINKSHLLFLNTALDNLLTQSSSHIPCAIKVSTKTQLSVTDFKVTSHGHEMMPHNRKTENCHQIMPNVQSAPLPFQGLKT